MSNESLLLEEIGAMLAAFNQNSNYANIIANARNLDWANASLQQREAVQNEFFACPQIQQVIEKTRANGYISNGIGGLLTGSFFAGGGGGGGVLSDTSESKGIGFGFGSAGLSVTASADFLFISYKGHPSEFWGLFHGAYGCFHLGIGGGYYEAHLGAGYDPRWQCNIWAVGAGAGIGGALFVGGAWLC